MPEGDNYEVLEKIGHGSFGVIRKVRRKTDGMVVCRKEISYLKMSQKEREQLHAEFQILSTLNHENIVAYYHREHLKSSQDLYLYMEYCGNGDLGRVIRDLQAKNQYAEESFVWSIFSQLVTALYRCHYGINPPEVGKNVLGLGKTAKPVTPPGTMTILHRDLKPENVFLGEGNLVKLGDFGLAKMILEHDFASTYVGTPFYMSPEICAAEKYTLKSDIWSLGCIIYELCTREPPFNAKTHVQLVQKIREGKITPIPKHYSPDLMDVIKECLRTNPERRPDTATLLNLPIVRLMRKEKEVVDYHKMVKQKEEAITTKMEQKMEAYRKELDASLHREWEVKARLEIDRVLKEKMTELEKRFENEVQNRLAEELRKRGGGGGVGGSSSSSGETPGSRMDLSVSTSKPMNDKARSSSSMGDGSADGEYSSAAENTELSTTSPDTSFNNSHANEPKRCARTPYQRAQTMFAGAGGGAGTPMDIEMVSPSPMAIASLSLSPRRNAGTKPPAAKQGNIFTVPSAISDEKRWHVPNLSQSSESAPDSDEDSMMPSPTRMVKRSAKNPFGKRNVVVLKTAAGAATASDRGGLTTQQQRSSAATANSRLKQQQPSLPAPVRGGATGNLHTVGSAGTLRSHSPNRRLSKIPSAANLGGGMMGGEGGPAAMTRKPSFSKKEIPLGGGLVSKKGNLNNVQGRTLVELSQARAGGRPLSAVLDNSNLQLSPTRRPFKEHMSLAGSDSSIAPGSTMESVATWNPDIDDMPSPFLIRQRPAASS